MSDIFSINFEAKITKCILEKNDSENIITLDAIFYDNSGFDQELFEDIDFQKYYFLDINLYPKKKEKFQKEEIFFSLKDLKESTETIDNRSVKTFSKSFIHKFQGDSLELRYSFGLNVNQIKLDFPFLEGQLDNVSEKTTKTIKILENGISKEFVQDFRNISFRKPVYKLRDKYSKNIIDTIFEKNVDLSKKIGKNNNFLSKVFTTYDDKYIYLHFFIDSREFVDKFCKYPQIISEPSVEVIKNLTIVLKSNENSLTFSVEPESIQKSERYVFYKAKMESNGLIGKSVTLSFLGSDFSIQKAIDSLNSLSLAIKSIQEQSWVSAKEYIKQIPYLLDEGKEKILEIISTERMDLSVILVENLQQIYSEYSFEIPIQNLNYNNYSSSQNGTNTKAVILFNKEVTIDKEKENVIDLGKSYGIKNNEVSYKLLKTNLDERLEKYFDPSLKVAEASKEKSLPFENTKYSYLNFNIDNIDKEILTLGESVKNLDSIFYSLIHGKKKDSDSNIKDSLFSEGRMTLQEEFTLVTSNQSFLASSLDLVFGTMKQQESKKTSLGNFDDTIDFSKMKKFISSLYILELLNETNPRDFSLDYYNLKLDSFTDLKFAVIDFFSSLTGESYLDNLPVSTKCLFSMFGKDKSKIFKDNVLFENDLVSFEKFVEFFFRYQFLFEIKYLEVGNNVNMAQWKRLTIDKVNSLVDDETLLCKLELFRDENIVNPNILNKMNYSLRNEYFRLGK